ncbi:unnamed protein product [Cercospora beticola]|nr:unnamed protein product [Cercospora beticola]
MIDPRPPPSADQPSKTPPPSYYLKSSRHEPSIMKDLITAIAALAVTCSAAVLPLLPSQPDKKISNIDQTGCVDVCQDKGFKNCMEANYTVATCTKFPEGISAARSMKLPNARWKCALYREPDCREHGLYTSNIFYYPGVNFHDFTGTEQWSAFMCWHEGIDVCPSC